MAKKNETIFEVVGHNIVERPQIRATGEIDDNGDSEYDTTTTDADEIIVRDEDGVFFSIVFTLDYGMCYSGYTTATWWTQMRIKYIPGNITPHVTNMFIHPRNMDTTFKMSGFAISSGVTSLETDMGYETYSCQFFKFDCDGGDSYYPKGEYELKLPLIDISILEDIVNSGFDEYKVTNVTFQYFNYDKNAFNECMSNYVVWLRRFHPDKFTSLPTDVRLLVL